MRLRNVKNAKEILENCELLINNPQDYKGNFNKLFNNNNPICLEIGMGKGQFIIELAKKHTNINYIGIEKMSSILFFQILFRFGGYFCHVNNKIVTH